MMEDEGLEELLAEAEVEEGEEEKVGLWSASSMTVVAVGAFGMIEYSMVMPSMAAYVQELGASRVFYGVAMAMFSAARLVFMPVFGVWSDRRPMIEPLVVSMVLGIVGNLMYGMAYGLKSPWFILLGRVFVGFGAANGTLSMSYITRITETKNRTKAMAMLNGINLIGIVIGPATNLLVNDISFHWGSVVVFNHLSNPGWFTAFLLMVLLGLILCTFEEPPKLSTLDSTDIEALDGDFRSGQSESDLFQPLLRTHSSMLSMDSPLSTISITDQLQERITQSCYRGTQAASRGVWQILVGERLWVHFVVSFCSNFVLSELEVSLPAMTGQAFGWSTIQNSIMYAIIGVLVAMTLVTIMVLSRTVSDRSFIIFGFVGYVIALTIACVFLRDPQPNFEMFLLVCVLLIASCPMTGSPNMGLYTKRLQEHEETTNQMGLYIGFLQGMNGISRTVAPIYSGFALLDESNHLLVYAGPLAVVLISVCVLWTNLRYFREEGSAS